jgi:hypothetical protein
MPVPWTWDCSAPRRSNGLNSRATCRPGCRRRRRRPRSPPGPRARPGRRPGFGGQVQQHLLEPLVVGPDGPAGVVRRGGLDGDVTLRGQRADQVDGVPDDPEHVHRLRRPRQAAGLAAGDVEHLVDQAEQVLAGRDDVVDALGLLSAELLEPEELGEAEDGVEGGAELVADPGQELALGPVGLVGVASGLLQGLLGMAALGDVGDHAHLADRPAVLQVDPRPPAQPACRPAGPEQPELDLVGLVAADQTTRPLARSRSHQPRPAASRARARRSSPARTAASSRRPRLIAPPGGCRARRRRCPAARAAP